MVITYYLESFSVQALLGFLADIWISPSNTFLIFLLYLPLNSLFIDSIMHPSSLLSSHFSTIAIRSCLFVLDLVLFRHAKRVRKTIPICRRKCQKYEILKLRSILWYNFKNTHAAGNVYL